MKDINLILEIVETFYPKREDFNEDLMPNNKFLHSLTIVCKKAVLELPAWKEKLLGLVKLMPDCEIIDDTLFEANEPSFQAYVINDKKKMRIHFHVSIIAPYFFSFYQSEKNEYNKIEGEILLQWLTTTFPDKNYISEIDCRQEINWIRVPSYYDEDITTTIADCIFGIRSLKGY
ncbi:hypothetical protein [Pedobacter sp. UBA5917]|jgi:hypothetical protein|uniref:hypothetical protein n=1 Tax=Pedobacter sp. UBA5917 TaxID=1947061 RepID=UPI0025ECEE9E|nr:hypothetical protein [Pedobacter sp. UBA5917]